MLSSESFTCEGGVGYPEPVGALFLQTDKTGTYEIVTDETTKRTSVQKNCSIIETFAVELVFFDASWNNTKVRCAFEESGGGIGMVSEEITIRLLPGKSTLKNISISFHKKLFLRLAHTVC